MHCLAEWGQGRESAVCATRPEVACVCSAQVQEQMQRQTEQQAVCGKAAVCVVTRKARKCEAQTRQREAVETEASRQAERQTQRQTASQREKREGGPERAQRERATR